MSHIHQVELVTQPQPPATPKPSRVTQLGARPSESTPITKKHGPNSPYSTAEEDLKAIRLQLAKEMEGRWLGAMPVDDFVEKYLPLGKNSKPLPELHRNPFENIPNGVESQRYNHFVSTLSFRTHQPHDSVIQIDVVNEWMPGLGAVNTSTKPDKVNGVNLKTDVSVYNRIDGVATPDRTDFSQMELWIEFKANSSGAPFRDPGDKTDKKHFIEEGSFTPDTEEGRETRGQLAHYAGAHHSLQFRHFSFSVFVQGDHARFLRWDPSSTVVTTAFNYRRDPELMAMFFWRFNHLTPEQRGHDPSVQPAKLPDDVDKHIREKLKIENESIPLYRYQIPKLDNGYAYGPRPETTNRSLVSRCTRSQAMLWIPNKDANDPTPSCKEPSSLGQRDANQTARPDKEKKKPSSEERIIYMKDTWRFLSTSPDVKVPPVDEIYQILYKHDTPNIPQDVVGGDIENGRTENYDLLSDNATMEWLCVQPMVSPYQHYRMVLWIVGKPLFKFECTRDLVVTVLHALQGEPTPGYVQTMH